MTRRRTIESAVLFAALAAIGACSSSSSDAPSPPAADAASGLKIAGKVTNAQSEAVIAGATISAAGATTATATSEASGVFTLPMPPNQPFSLLVKANDFSSVIFQELSASADADVDVIPLISTQTYGLLKNLMEGFDTSKAVMAIQTITTGGCASEQGATVTVSPPGGSLIYFKGGLPSKTAQAMTAGEEPSAVAYNLDPQTTYTLIITSPSCTQAAYPHVDGPLTYTGKITVSAEALAEAQVFLK